MSTSVGITFLSLIMRFFFFFFLMIRRPPRSTLFPTRRSSDLLLLRLGDAPFDASAVRPHPQAVENGFGVLRSEEHTSELQSLTNLVCRLLLEKKNKTTSNSATTWWTLSA